MDTKKNIKATVEAVNYQEMTTDKLIILRDERRIKYAEIEKDIADLGIKRSRRLLQAGSISQAAWYTHKHLSKDKTKVAGELTLINAELNKRGGVKKINDDIFKQVIISVVGQQTFDAIIYEAGRRMMGMPELKVPVYVPGEKKADDGKSQIYTKHLREYHEMLVKARIAITQYVRENEPELNKGDYLKSVTLINTAIPTEMELNKKRRIIGF